MGRSRRAGGRGHGRDLGARASLRGRVGMGAGARDVRPACALGRAGGGRRASRAAGRHAGVEARGMVAVARHPQGPDAHPLPRAERTRARGVPRLRARRGGRGRPPASRGPRRGCALDVPGRGSVGGQARLARRPAGGPRRRRISGRGRGRAAGGGVGARPAAQRGRGRRPAARPLRVRGRHRRLRPPGVDAGRRRRRQELGRRVQHARVAAGGADRRRGARRRQRAVPGARRRDRGRPAGRVRPLRRARRRSPAALRPHRPPPAR